jgi:hypothetical protein
MLVLMLHDNLDSIKIVNFYLKEFSIRWLFTSKRETLIFYSTQCDVNDMIGFARTAEMDKQSRGTTPYLWIVYMSDNDFR